MRDEYRMIGSNGSDIMNNCNDMRNKFGYNLLYEICPWGHHCEKLLKNKNILLLMYHDEVE